MERGCGICNRCFGWASSGRWTTSGTCGLRSRCWLSMPGKGNAPTSPSCHPPLTPCQPSGHSRCLAGPLISPAPITWGPCHLTAPWLPSLPRAAPWPLHRLTRRTLPLWVFGPGGHLWEGRATLHVRIWDISGKLGSASPPSAEKDRFLHLPMQRKGRRRNLKIGSGVRVL
jgi:hypothetical protein